MDLALVLVVAAIALVGWLALAPASLGGGNRYGAVEGTSMEPNLTAGDFIVVRPGTYDAGDIVAYPMGRQLVVHRVVGFVDGRLVLRGDANSSVDWLQPTPDEVLGEVRVRVPYLGAAFAFLHRHLLGLIIAGALSVAIFRRLGTALTPARPVRSTPTL